jgi:3-oxoacyl-[acyl-carrier protein] reductase
MRLEGKSAVVTGGSRGIGRAICRALAAEGAAVVVNYATNEAAALDVVREITGAGGRAIPVQADVSRDEEAFHLIDAAIQAFGRLDLLVNNAACTERVPHDRLDLLTDEMIDRILAVNVKGTLYCSRAALPHLRETRGGIINITSVAGLLGNGSSVIYGASKAAITTMGKSLARAFAPEVRVNSVAPGWVDTGFGDWPPETGRLIARRSPIARPVTVEDVAAAVLFLARDGAAFTGQEIVVDGGIVALGAR